MLALLGAATASGAQSQGGGTSSAARDAIARLRIQEAATPVRSHPRWQPPKKVVLLAWGAQWDERTAQLQSMVPAATRVVAATSPQHALTEVADADAMVGFNPEVCDARLLGAAKQLRWLQSLSAGVELCAEGAAAKIPGLLMTNMRGVDSAAIAEHAVAMMLALAHGLDAFAVDTAQGEWNRGRAGEVRMQMLQGKTLLVVGLGGIGTEVASRGAALGMKVVATRQGPGDQPPFVSHIGQPDELLALTRTADVVVSCVPLTKETHRPVRRALLRGDEADGVLRERRAGRQRRDRRPGEGR